MPFPFYSRALWRAALCLLLGLNTFLVGAQALRRPLPASLAPADPPVQRPASPDDAHWQDGFDQQGVNGSVTTIVRVPNGDLLVGGNFSVAGGVVAHGVARWDGQRWHALGGGLRGTVNALAIAPNGDVVAGVGILSSTAANVFRWDGTTWTAVGGGVPWVVRAVLVQPNGDVVAGGEFSGAGGSGAASGLARWDGTAWQPFGTPITGQVYALTTAPNGDLLAGGSFRDVGGNPNNDGVMRWDGNAWQPFGTGVTVPAQGRVVRALVALPNGDVVVGGTIDRAGGTPARSVARWHNGAWSPLGSGLGSSLNERVDALLVLPNGDVVAGGLFANPALPSNVARWDGTTWQPLGSGRAPWGAEVKALVGTSAADLTAGWLRDPESRTDCGLARWDGADWRSLNPGLNGPVWAILPLPNGDMLVGGAFTDAGGNLAADHLARWDGAAWQSVGQGLNDEVYCLTQAMNGDILVGGVFTDAGGNPAADKLVRWTSAGWQAVGPGPAADYVAAIVERPSGELIAGGARAQTLRPDLLQPIVQRWDGILWQVLPGFQGGPNIGVSFTVETMRLLPNGTLLAGGFFQLGTPVLYNLARWDGTAWQPFGPQYVSFSWVRALALAANGDLLVGGNFHDGNSLHNLARYDGAWHEIGGRLGIDRNDYVFGIAELPGGDILAAGHFTYASANALGGIARWDGQAWQPLGSGLNDDAYVVKSTASGDAFVGGNFTAVGDGSKVTAYFGIYRQVLGAADELPARAAFTLAPNPATTTVQLAGATAATAQVYDGLGRCLRTVPLVAGAATLDVRGLAPGVYVVRAGGSTRRLVVQ